MKTTVTSRSIRSATLFTGIAHLLLLMFLATQQFSPHITQLIKNISKNEIHAQKENQEKQLPAKLPATSPMHKPSLIRWVSRTAGNSLPKIANMGSTTAIPPSPASPLPASQENIQPTIASIDNSETSVAHTAINTIVPSSSAPERTIRQAVQPDSSTQQQIIKKTLTPAQQAHASHQQNQQHQPHQKIGTSSAQSTAQKPVPAAKRPLTLAQLAQGFTKYMANEQVNTQSKQTYGDSCVRIESPLSGKPSTIQLVLERHCEKILQCLSTTRDTFSYTHGIGELPKEIDTPTISISYCFNSKKYTISLTCSSGYREFDTLCTRMFTEASSSFPPVPPILQSGDIPFTLVITINPPVSSKTKRVISPYGKHR